MSSQALTTRGIVAGDAFATFVLRSVSVEKVNAMVHGLMWQRVLALDARLKIYVDDLTLQCFGTGDRLVGGFVAGVNLLIALLRSVELPEADDKLVIISHLRAGLPTGRPTGKPCKIRS